MTGRNGEKMSLTLEIEDQWSPAWRQVNAEFEAAMRKDEALEDMCSKMFFIYDGNHRHMAWKSFIDEKKSEDTGFIRSNGQPETIMLDISLGGFPKILKAMDSVNK